MVLTSNSDIFVSIHDKGINRIINHIRLQRPALFNFGTLEVLSNETLLCKQKIEYHPDVIDSQNPLVTILKPIPVYGSNFSLPFCVQLTSLKIDFYPKNEIMLPSNIDLLELHNLALQIGFCVGLGCPSDEILNLFLLRNRKIRIPPAIQNREITLPVSTMNCFCLDIFLINSAKITGLVGNQNIEMKLKDMEISDIKPKGIENIIECYMKLVANLVLLPQIGNMISNIAFNLIELPENSGSIKISGSTAVENNPAIDEDQIKMYVNLDNIDLNIDFTIPNEDLLPAPPSVISKIKKERTRDPDEPNDFQVALSQDVFTEFFRAVVSGLSFRKNDTGNWGAFHGSYDIEGHLEGGTVEFRDDGTIHIKELDIIWDKLQFNLGVNIPSFCVGGGGCIIPNPLNGCLVESPEFCLFEENPDLDIPINLSGLRSEVTFTAGIDIWYSTLDDGTNKWQINIHPNPPLDIDIADIADMIGDAIENALDSFIPGLDIPDWATALIGSVPDLVRNLLDIGDDIDEWVSDFLKFNVGLLDFAAGFLIDALANQSPVYEIDDPMMVLPESTAILPLPIENNNSILPLELPEFDPPLIPVKIPIEFIDIKIDSNELAVRGDIGN